MDEVGIGPLAGPVVAAAVLLDSGVDIPGITDSKALSPGKRAQLAQQIRDGALCFALGWATEGEIDKLNILQASHLAMQRAVADFTLQPTMVWVDGNKTPQLPMPCVAVVKGDKLVEQISAASILAKVARDEYMVNLESSHPGYGFAQHKGYPTKQHLNALAELGPTVHHRRSFAPVRRALA